MKLPPPPNCQFAIPTTVKLPPPQQAKAPSSSGQAPSSSGQAPSSSGQAPSIYVAFFDYVAADVAVYVAFFDYVAADVAVYMAFFDYMATDVADNATLRFTSDGRLAVEQAQGQQINIFDAGGAYFATMQDSRNFVLYDSTGTRARYAIRWDIVLYPNRGKATDQAYWDTKTFTSGATLNLDYYGNLYLLHKSTSFIKNLTQGGCPTKDALYVIKFDADGIFRLYYYDLSNKSKNGSVTWASSSNMCTGKGLCGNNGYCVVRNHNARCRCIPGFEFVNRKRRSSGCRRTYTAESCRILDAQTAI
ncbi:G-type lectin S-receptor-like serine/threonine-protein kinase LECRK1 [Helianthus annuus]|uniref:G-type lectin S-receptor-like serine/threonine-protein kinase LECRK1 n=1 Tax=Helianthus annuus TaxID=4232 RepID=UPI001652C40F|nr:G-type lectin S-receptor-like serine/threonine-protein kinase LECRK1 [Helianthus annuus]